MQMSRSLIAIRKKFSQCSRTYISGKDTHGEKYLPILERRTMNLSNPISY